MEVIARVHVAGSQNGGHDQDDEGHDAMKYHLEHQKIILYMVLSSCCNLNVILIYELKFLQRFMRGLCLN